jgi:CHAT domain-containing protein/tetratricopeptide (TPR) repeat protein
MQRSVPPHLPSLEQNRPLERELAGGEAHSYQLTLSAGHYARVVVEQRGIDIVVSVFDQDGKKILESDKARAGDPETISLLAETPAIYRIEARSQDVNALKGRYEISLRELRAASAQDKTRAEAEKLGDEAILLYRMKTAESLRKAIEKYQQAKALWQSIKESAEEANALYMIGHIWIYLGDSQKALDSCNQALALARAAGNLRVQAYALDTIGMVYNESGDKKRALEMFNQALPLRHAAGDRVGEVYTLNNIGMAHGWMGEWPKALDSFKRVRAVLSSLGDRRNEASVLNNMCVIHTDLGQYKGALDHCNQAILIHRSLNNREGEAIATNNSGNAYSNLGRYQDALDAYNKAREIHKEMADSKGEAISLNNIGWVYATLGEYQKAIDFYNEALAVFRRLGDQYGEATILGNIGVNYADMGDYQKSLDIQLKVLPLRQAAGDSAGQSITLNNIANCYSNLGEKQKALDYYDRAISIHQAVGNRQQQATTLRNIGALHRDLGDHRKARRYFNEGLQLSRGVSDRKNEAGILAHLARLERDQGNLLDARRCIEEALAAVESLRINVKSHQLRASFFSTVSKYHDFNVDLLMRLHKERPSEGFDSMALQASERGRARSLLGLLAETRAEIQSDINPALIERERNLRQMISDKAERQTRLLSGKHTEDQAAAAAKEIDALTIEYEQAQALIRQASPRYAALTEPAPLTLKEIQSEVLDDETLLLEYALGEEKSFVWAVTPSSISSFELPPQAEIRQAARRVYEILTARGNSAANETQEGRRRRIARAEAEYPEASMALSRLLLGPVASELKNKRLLIVGEDVLHYSPFAALPKPGAPGSRPLVVDHEIISLPSASVLAVLRRETAGRRAPAKSIAIFADPVFSSGDPRINPAIKNRATTSGETASTSEVKRSAAESGLRDFVRLRFSRQEADHIARFAAESKKLKAIDFAASRAAAINPELGQYAMLHFATHGLINNQHPELSGVVLSLVDEQGRPQNGFLRLYDIYNLKLEANLVVLSACQTALGKEIKGEGLVGITRGFMYAGAPRIVASLWQIDDRATAEFMRRFYQAVLVEGARPAAALRGAQISMWKDKRWEGPHYWAAFTLQGEWK